MTELLLVAPLPELVQEWVAEIWHEGTSVRVAASDLHIATQAARWGADQELEACCKLLDGAGIFPPDGAKTYPENLSAARERMGKLRAARRPKPPSLKERLSKAIIDGDEKEALKLLEQLDD